MVRISSGSTNFRQIYLGHQASHQREIQHERKEGEKAPDPLPPSKSKTECHIRTNILSSGKLERWIKPRPCGKLMITYHQTKGYQVGHQVGHVNHFNHFNQTSCCGQEQWSSQGLWQEQQPTNVTSRWGYYQEPKRMLTICLWCWIVRDPHGDPLQLASGSVQFTQVFQV